MCLKNNKRHYRILETTKLIHNANIAVETSESLRSQRSFKVACFSSWRLNHLQFLSMLLRTITNTLVLGHPVNNFVLMSDDRAHLITSLIPRSNLLDRALNAADQDERLKLFNLRMVYGLYSKER